MSKHDPEETKWETSRATGETLLSDCYRTLRRIHRNTPLIPAEKDRIKASMDILAKVIDNWSYYKDRSKDIHYHKKEV